MVSSNPGYYYGDQWLYLRDAYGMMTPEEAFMFQVQTNTFMIPENEMAYYTGAKKRLAYSAIGFHQVNKCLRENPSKYKPIFEKKGMLIDYSKFNKKTKDKDLSMFR